jgi:hypothetical protein
MRYFRCLCLLTLLLCQCSKDNVAPDTIKYWYENIGSRTDIPFLPDAGANYFSYSFKRAPGQKIGIRLSSKFMYARYQSFNVYDTQTRSSLYSLADYEMVADAGSENPFITLNQSNNRNYTVYLLPDIPEAATFQNKLLYGDEVTELTLILRNYLPEGDVFGSVDLPVIEAFDLETGNTVATPQPLAVDFAAFNDIVGQLSRVINLTQLLQEGNTISSFRFAGLGLFPNLDNQYLFAPLKLGPEQVAILKFLPPSFPETFNLLPTSEVRYYSLGLGDSKTYNYKTLSDFQLKIASDGFIYVVIGRNDPEIMAKSDGLNFLEWVPELNNQGLIVYRNLLTTPDYAFNMNEVPDLLQNLSQVFEDGFLNAETYLGDRAPLGRKMSKAAFLDNFGGFEVGF